ncbi:MAG TPA: hypothetical protein VG737_00445 [Cyclobacteriaceae bacterium]|nr:hypothetical protein [Cyclobacteriaceae bacterium]
MTLQDNAITESVELRWFFSGQLPGAILQRFKDFAAARKFETSKESRSDYYLRNKRETVGVKLRKDGDEKDIEMKFLKASVPHEERNVSGQVERWRKWRFPAGKFNFRNERSVLESEWIAVSKTRYQVNIPGPATKSRMEGCGFEITSLASAQGSFWTIGFEGFSDKGREETNFLHAVDLTHAEFFTDGGNDDIRFSKDNSFSYPKFIRERLMVQKVATLRG